MTYNFVPAQAASYRLDLNGLGSIHITEVAGIDHENDVVEHKVVSDKGVEMLVKLPGNYKGGDLTLKRGVDADLTLTDWFKQVKEGAIAKARMDGSVVALDSTGADLAQWDFTFAWPSKLGISGFKSDADDVVTEEITVVYETLKRVK